MKKRLILLMLSLLIVLSCLAGCTSQTENTDDPVSTVAPDATSNPVPTPSQKPNATPTPTGGELVNVELGIPNENSEEIFSDIFDEIHPEVSLRYKYGYYLKDNTFRFDTTLAMYYMPYIEMFFDENILQYEVSVKFSTKFPANKNPTNDPSKWNTWMFPHFGVSVYDLGDGYNCADEDSGLWMGITDKDVATIFHGVPSHWPKGACKITLPESFSEEHTLTIIQDYRGIVNYYMNTADNDLTLICKIDMSGDTLTVSDAAGETVYSAPNNLKGQEGYFKIFNHFGDTIMSNVTIKELRKK